MVSAHINLEGIRAMGRHGASPGEKLEAQEFVVDLDVVVEVSQDSLEATADYRALADLARGAVESNSFDLLESLADAVARAVYDLTQVIEVTATVSKPRAAERMGLDAVSATVTLA